MAKRVSKVLKLYNRRCVLGTVDFNLIMRDPFKEPSEHTNGRWVLGSMEFNLIARDPFKNLTNIPMGVGF